MYIRLSLGMLIVLFMGACTPTGTLNTEDLEVERKGTHMIYMAVEKDISFQKALPFEMKYPSYFPFEKEETGVRITGWENGKEKVVTSIRYPSIEVDAKWEKDSTIQSAIPHVNYTVANFDRYYSKYSNMDAYKEVNIKGGITGLFKETMEMKGAQLHWFQGEKEFNLELMYFSEDREELKSELLRIANTI